MDESASAGDFCLHFIHAVVAVIGRNRSLDEHQIRTIRELCSLTENRPFPTAVWARLIEKYLGDVDFLTDRLERVLEDKRHLLQSIGKVTANEANSIGLSHGARVLVHGYSGVVSQILKALPLELKGSLHLYATARFRRNVNEGVLLKSEYGTGPGAFD
jgi:hypothetical protein